MIEIDGEGFREFQRDLRKLDRQLANSLNRELRNVLRSKLLPAAKANASWSSRIPGAIKPQVTQKHVALRVNAKQAPHGRPYEGLQNGLRSRGKFRHPVFGNRAVWVSQPTRPFLAPAFRANEDEAVKAVREAVADAARQAGWR